MSTINLISLETKTRKIQRKEREDMKPKLSKAKPKMSKPTKQFERHHKVRIKKKGETNLYIEMYINLRSSSEASQQNLKTKA